MFGPVQPTQFDLYFSLFGIPVRVIPTFWLVGALFGFPLLQEGRGDLVLIWIACLFVSILVHEMGHALSAQAFGWPPQVFLYHFGGLAVFDPWRGYTMGRSIFISFAGPAAGFLLFGLVVAVELLLNQRGVVTNDYWSPLGQAFIQLKFINLYWGLVNLLPVLPLDGGRICEALCSHFIRRGNAADLTLKIGIGVGAVAAVFFFSQGRTYAGVLFALLAYQNFQAYQQRHSGYW